MRFFLELAQKKLLIDKGFSYLISPEYYSCLYGEKDCSKEIKRELEFLEKLGYLPSGDNILSLEKEINIGVLGLTLTTGCNLACNYCSAGYYRKQKGNKNISIETIQSAIDFFIQNTTYKKLWVVFYGGEPLMNWEGVKFSVEYTKKKYNKNWRFLLETNGTLIDEEKANFLVKNNVFILFSLSSKEIQDRYRPTVEGKPSYKMALRGLKELIHKGAKGHVKSVIPERAITVDEERRKLEAELPSNISISVIYEKKLLEAYFSQENFNSCFLFTEGIGKNEKGDFFSLDLAVYLRIIFEISLPRYAMCSAGIGGYLVDIDGNVTVCQNTLGIPEYNLGTVKDFNYRKAKEIKERFLKKPEVCKNCWINRFCGYCYLLKDKSLPVEKSYCEYKRNMMVKALEIASEMDDKEIINMYKVHSLPESLEKLKKALILRRLIWKENRHIRPIFLFPAGDLNSQVNPWDLTLW